MTDSPTPRPVVLCILDGWGEREETDFNAIAAAETPVWDLLRASCPRARLDASGSEVGLPDGQMGNSEVGHTNIGAGRVVKQDLPRIDAAIADGGLAEGPVLVDFIEALKQSGGTAHLMGLMSPGGVHSHQNQIAALANILADADVPVAVHAFLDGRDTPPSSGRGHMEEFLAAAPRATIATVIGRYYAMDRDNRWDRVEKACAAMAEGAGEAGAPDALAAIDAAHAAGLTDEFVPATVIGGFQGMADGDGILMANFRADRARELLSALLDPNFGDFARPRHIGFATATGLVEYSAALAQLMTAIFPPISLDNVLGQVVADAGLKQLRIAETEKYAHVTFFLNGGREDEFPGEDRILIPSPRVATYDLQPEMSAGEVTDRLVGAIEDGTYDLIVVNYANTDMVGHTGILEAAIKAVEAVDGCLGRLEAAVRAAGGALLITADHGNVENMRDATTGQPHTAHTQNLVPLMLVADAKYATGLTDGRLSDLAPTILELMGLARPVEMTGRSLIARGDEKRATG
ncbi:MAG: 2,3-bisphosphoglycerate-independent phosphoglycerate mutase [Alphaproteobacteria bacterium]|nr:2,3-bisphosphoglycerate-independent phosphoglycerate mutase [Alphaproteobacteria bacterium]